MKGMKGIKATSKSKGFNMEKRMKGINQKSLELLDSVSIPFIPFIPVKWFCRTSKSKGFNMEKRMKGINQKSLELLDSVSIPFIPFIPVKWFAFILC